MYKMVGSVYIISAICILFRECSYEGISHQHGIIQEKSSYSNNSDILNHTGYDEVNLGNEKLSYTEHDKLSYNNSSDIPSYTSNDMSNYKVNEKLNYIDHDKLSYSNSSDIPSYTSNDGFSYKVNKKIELHRPGQVELQ